MHLFRLLSFGFLSTVTALTHAKMPPQDTVKGAKDHPLVSRYDGARMVGYEARDFDEISLPAGKAVAGKDNKDVFEKSTSLEGKYTRIAYNFAPDRSAAEVMRNYQTALEHAGIKPSFSCAKESCGKGFGELFLGRFNPNFIQDSSAYWSPFNYGRLEPRYLLAKGARPDGSQVHVAVYVVPPAQQENGGVYLEIIESKPMEGGKVAVNLNAEAMAKGIHTEGKIALYGVYFDTDKADIKPESKPTLMEMAKLLQKDAALKVHIVGHTDNQGSVAHNVDLSQRRAESVVKTLVADYKIDPKRLSAKGVASYAPVASNESDMGRTKNRRVELVKQ